MPTDFVCALFIVGLFIIYGFISGKGNSQPTTDDFDEYPEHQFEDF